MGNMKNLRKDVRIIDSHTHVHNPENLERLVHSESKHDIDRFCVLSCSCLGAMYLKENLVCALAKVLYPGKIYGFGGLYYPEDGTPVDASSLYEQAKFHMQLGFDGIKMLEGKPDTRKKTGIPLDSPVYDRFFAYLEENGIPVIYHVGDPKIFWDKDKAPDWAVKEGWVYTDGTFVSKERLYDEVNGFLRKFPRLKVTFAHFFFMGEEGIKRASEFLDQWPNVNYDITPGIEMYGSFSEEPEKWREFFVKYSDRILFGSDNGIDESLVYIDVTRNFLETSNEFSCRDMNITGISLEKDILDKIYRKNFERFAGTSPKAVDMEAVFDECRRVLAIVEKDKDADILVPQVQEIIDALRAGI